MLTSLPLLLDQSHLTDVTLSAEGRTVRAHRVVLSACSSFFSELFRTLDAPFHPVIVIPGATFGSIVALLTFMYSGEVNVFEEQISTLLSLAETLGIKGLADINGVGLNHSTDHSKQNHTRFQSSKTSSMTIISHKSNISLHRKINPVTMNQLQNNHKHHHRQQYRQHHPHLRQVMPRWQIHPTNFQCL